MRKTYSLKRFGLIASIALVAVALNPIPASAAWFTTQLTENEYVDRYPQISGNNVVWEGYEGGNDDEIFLYNGSSTTQLTNNGYHDYAPQISGNSVVWQAAGWIDDNEIFLYNGTSTTLLTNNNDHDVSPHISGNNVVWKGHDGNDWEIFFYNGSSTTQLTDNSYHDYAPQISGNSAVWSGGDFDNREIFFYNGSSTTQLTNNGYDDYAPQISGNNIVWLGQEGGNDNEIFFYNGSSTAQLTNDSKDDWGPQISGNNVVWYGYDGNDWEIFLYNGSSTTQLTNNSYNDSGARVSGNNVVWSGSDGNDSEIFLARFESPAPSDPAATSSSHIVGAWSKDNTIDVGFTGASDNQSGVDGFSYDWNQSPTHFPDKIKDVEETKTSVTSRPLANGAWYFHLRTVDSASNWSSTIHLGPFKIDTKKPTVKMVTPFVSTRISKTTTFKVKWSATDPAPSSEIRHYTVRYRPSTSKAWRTWKANTNSTYGYFKGKAGVTYYFRTKATDNAGNSSWSKVYKTLVPFNEGIFLRKIGFFGYKKLGRSQNYLTSVRYSYRRGHTLVYKLYRNNGIGLVVTKGPKMGRAKIYVDGKYVTTVDAKSSKTRPRQLIYYRNFSKKGTHYLKVVNLGTPGRARFEVDGVVVKR